MKEIKQPVITEDDVLAGQITFPVSKRKGGTVDITVKALPWRAAESERYTIGRRA